MGLLDEAEKDAIAKQAGYDLALRFALEGLRRAENGGPQKPNVEDWKARNSNPFVGGEFGVQTLAAPTFAQQLKVAAVSILNSEARYFAWMIGQMGHAGAEHAQRPRNHGGLHTEKFLRYFSGRWAPRDDIRNKDHANNLVSAYARAVGEYEAALGGPPPAGAAAREAA